MVLCILPARYLNLNVERPSARDTLVAELAVTVSDPRFLMFLINVLLQNGFFPLPSKGNVSNLFKSFKCLFLILSMCFTK